MRTLTHSEAVALWNWAVKNHKKNWGVWTDYPVSGCTYLQYEDNSLIVKFDTEVEYEGEKFTRIGWGRRIPGKGQAVMFATLYDLIPPNVRPKKEVAPSHEWEGPEGIIFKIEQCEYADYAKHTFSAVYPNGHVRDGFTTSSKLYGMMMESKPENIEIF